MYRASGGIHTMVIQEEDEEEYLISDTEQDYSPTRRGGRRRTRRCTVESLIRTSKALGVLSSFA